MSRCPECGAEVADGADCQANLHALLELESRIPGGPGMMPHFYAVATFNLQHPRTMNLAADTLDGLRAGVRDALAGRATIEDLRRRARDGARRAGRVTRRDGDPEVAWGVDAWPMIVTDVVPCPPDADEYARRVAEWARSVVDAIERAAPGG